MSKRGIVFVVLMMLVLFNGCQFLQQSDEQYAVQIASKRMRDAVGDEAVNQSQIEVRPATNAWMVIFHNINFSCRDNHPFMPGMCGMGYDPTLTYRDIYFCVQRNFGQVYGTGASPQTLGPKNECEDLLPNRTVSPHPPATAPHPDTRVPKTKQTRAPTPIRTSNP